MGVLALGLLGAAALFPVGGYYMQTGDVADRSDAIAQAALNDAVTRGWLNPKNWAAAEFPVQATPPPQAVSTRMFRRNVINRTQALLGVAATTPPRIASEIGSAFVIDPQGIASAGTDYIASTRNFNIGNFPISATTPAYTLYATGVGDWLPWRWSNNSWWPIKRVTIRNFSTTTLWTPTPLMGEAAFRSASASDDLAIELPAAADKPAQQRYSVNGSTPVQRTPREDFSWVISVVPTSYEAYRLLTTSPGTASYDVSAVVFHKRVTAAPLTLAASDDDISVNQDLLAGGERSVQATVVTTGVNGGEILLTRINDWNLPESPFKELKAGQWVMLCGPHPMSTSLRPFLFMQWYRVLSVEAPSSATRGFDNSKEQQLVSLRGPDWPWTGAEPISQDLRVGIFPSIVAVHTKTMRLEAGSEWSVE